MSSTPDICDTAILRCCVRKQFIHQDTLHIECLNTNGSHDETTSVDLEGIVLFDDRNEDETKKEEGTHPYSLQERTDIHTPR